jgi:hypothetical protein
MIEFVSNYKIRYVNRFKVEQIVPMDIDLDGRSNLVLERNLEGTTLDITFFSRHYDQGA